MIVFHADDYGISVNASKEILELAQKGCLDGFSIIPNMSCFDQCMALLTPAYPDLKKTVDIALHINLFEGHCVAPAIDVSLLVDENGYFKPSWIHFFKSSYLPGRKLLKEQLEIEIGAQIDKLLKAMPADYELCVDSHQHSHMIPVVWDALRSVLKKKKLTVKTVRISKEPLKPYLSTPELYYSYSPVNLVKNIIIRFCTIHTVLRPINRKAQKGYSMWGLIMGCHMDEKRVRKLLPKFQPYGSGEKTLEILFHPGTLLPQELSSEYNKQEFIDAETSKNRSMERSTVLSLGSIPSL